MEFLNNYKIFNEKKVSKKGICQLSRKDESRPGPTYTVGFTWHQVPYLTPNLQISIQEPVPGLLAIIVTP